MRHHLIRGVLCVAAALGASAASVANADSVWGFQALSSNSPIDAATAGQYRVHVSDEIDGTVGFTFYNLGSAASSITDLYFDDGTPTPGLLAPPPGSPVITSGSGASFSVGASPHDLPGGNAVDFSATTGSDSNPPAQPNGVNNTADQPAALLAGEWVKLTFALQGGATYQSVYDALGTQDLRIGIHVQGFANGGSESFVDWLEITPTGQPPAVPLPAAVWAGMALFSTLGVVKFRARRRLASQL